MGKLHPSPVPERAVFVLADLEAGGAQRVVLNLAGHLDPVRVRPHLVVVNPWGPLGRDLPRDIPIHCIGKRRLRHALPGLLDTIRRLRPCAVVTTVSHLNLALLAARFWLPDETRLFVREANTPSIRLQKTRHPYSYRLLYRILYPRADAILCNSEAMRRDMVRSLYLPPGRIRVIPNPVDTARVTARISGSKNPYSGHNVQLVSVGRLHEQKGFDLLIRVFKWALDKEPGMHLTLVGGGGEEGRLVELSRRLGVRDALTFAGHRDNPYPYMAHADLFISSSRYEGSPNAVLESLACGTPVLAFDCPGGTREIVEEGRNGWLVPSEDIGAMATRLISIVKARAWEGLEADALLPVRHRMENVLAVYEELFAR